MVQSATPASNSYISSNYRLPSKSPWRNNTVHYIFSRNQVLGGGRMSIAEVLCYDSQNPTYSDK